VSDDGLDGAEPQLALDGAEHAALLARNEDATGILRVLAAISLVDIGPLDGQHGGRLRAVDDVPWGMTAAEIIGQRLGVQHEQATGRGVCW
jgi:hypothetical protein